MKTCKWPFLMLNGHFRPLNQMVILQIFETEICNRENGHKGVQILGSKNMFLVFRSEAIFEKKLSNTILLLH